MLEFYQNALDMSNMSVWALLTDYFGFPGLLVHNRYGIHSVVGYPIALPNES